MNEGEEISRREQLRALRRVSEYRPRYTATIIIGGVVAALLEGVGLSFILPIVEVVQAPGDPAQNADGMLAMFVALYQSVGIQFTLRNVVAGVSLVLAVRWTLTFVVRWLREALVVDYTRKIQTQAFDNALDAQIEYFDREGSDDILNAIVTQAEYAGRVIRYVVNFLEQGFLASMYLAVAFYLAPMLTIFAIGFLGGFSFLFRYFVESGYELGDKVADANERVQQTAQAGTQGIRDTKLFGLKQELFEDFIDAVNQFARASIRQKRNEQGIKSFYNLLTAISVFVLIYLAISFANMSLASLGVFLFAMFRLGPKASSLNSTLYRIENNLPHLVRTQEFIDELERNSEPEQSSGLVPEKFQTVAFEDVQFSYDSQEETVLDDVSFEFKAGEFIGFAGPSGAGKSTIVSLLTRMYEPDSGEITVNQTSLNRLNLDEWRSRVSVVRQDPFIFNDTLRYNVTVGNREAPQNEIERVCEIAQVTEFLDELPNRYETNLGDNGVRLSGGQRQRISIARALLKDSDVLVLDEATSDLDSKLEELVHDAIETMERNQAMLVIAHRLSTVMNADRIYTMQNGEITETGTHEDLVQHDGQYAKLYAAQTKN
jgi:subfamily B ATP-binding cassette protein MsbA